MSEFSEHDPTQSEYRAVLDLLGPKIVSLRPWLEQEIPARFRSLLTADDVLQEAWARILRSDLHGIRSIESWLREVVRNTLLVSLRQMRAVKRGGQEQHVQARAGHTRTFFELLASARIDDHTPSRNIGDEELGEVVAISLATLPEPQRRAVTRHYLDGVDRTTLAAELAITPGALAGLLQRGVQRLREMLHDAHHFVARSDDVSPRRRFGGNDDDQA